MLVKILLKLFLLVFVGGQFCAFAQVKPNAAYNEIKSEKSNTTQLSKIYVQPDQIYVNDEGMFVEVEGNLYQVTQIHQDENGIFIPCARFFWYCPYGHPNPPWRLICLACYPNTY